MWVFFVLATCLVAHYSNFVHCQQRQTLLLYSQSAANSIAASSSAFSSGTQFSVEYDLNRRKRNLHVLTNYQKTQLRHAVNKRSLPSSSSSPSCASAPVADSGELFSSHAFPPPPKKGDYDTITLLWAGKDNSTKIVGLLHSTGAVNASVYVGNDSNLYSKSKGLDGIRLSLLERNPDNPSHVLAIGKKNDEYQSCVSNDTAFNFQCSNMLPTYAPAGTILFNGKMVMTIMKPQYSFMEDYVLVVSKDEGQTWDIVHHGVTAALFKIGSKDTVFALTQIDQSFPFQDWFSISSETQLMSVNVATPKSPTVSSIKGLNQTSVTGFQYAGDFLHVVAIDDDGHKILKISDDHGETFNDTHLPSTTSGQYINILNTDSRLIFAHVTSASDAKVGTLYTSGEKGLFYSQSLANHVSDDFYNVESMDGVYITTRRLADRSLSTVISMDRGAEWNPITVKDCNEDDCTLQIYGKYLIDLHKEKHDSLLAQGPHSSANARGLIVVQGMLGSKIPYNSGSLQYNYSSNSSVFVSGDGGYTWIQALDGAYHILIEDSGGVIQALAMNKPLTKIYYSADEGGCWHNTELGASLTNFTIKGLLSQPGQKGLHLGIVGHGAATASNAQITWEIIDVDFKKILQRPCGANDMERWDSNPKCYLGQKRSYQRIKKSAWCYLNTSANVSAKVEYCACTRADYECEYGFIKDETTKDCVKDKEFKSATYCLDNKVYALDSSGYRKLPGDKCTGDTEYDAIAKTRALDMSCDEGDPSSFLDTAIVKTKLCGPEQAASSEAPRGGYVAAIVILTLISTILCVALTALYCKYSTLRRHYQYGSFEEASWSAGPSNFSGQSEAANEAVKIAKPENGGRSYTRLKETGAESDVDLLNM